MLILSRPSIFSFEITSACNNGCPGCSNIYAGQRSTRDVLPASAWAEIIASITGDAVRIRITGGEPTLHPDFFPILRAAVASGAWVTVFSNGRWQSPRAFLRQVPREANFCGFLVSVHGSRAETHESFTHIRGSFEETLANIRLAREMGIGVAVSSVLTQQNIAQMEEIVDLAENLGAEYVAFNRYLGRPLPGQEATREQMRKAVETIEALIRDGRPVQYGIGIPQCLALNLSEGCLAGAAYVSIDPWGRMRPCSHSPTVVGSLLEHSLDELWHSEAMAQWRALTPADCFECAAFATCHGGCKASIELRGALDPLWCGALETYIPTETIHEFPAEGKPLIQARLRPEPFGYAVLGEGQVLPVSESAREVIEACDGETSFAAIAEQFGREGLDLLGDLWDAGLLKINAGR